MAKSRRAQRMGKQNSRLTAKASLNLTSLMDIFTILVFFLMFNQSDNQITQTEAITLPDSFAAKMPKDALVVQVSADDIIVQGKSTDKTVDILTKANEKEMIIPGLKDELAFQIKRSDLNKPPTPDDLEKGRRVIIVADHKVKYELLKKVMATCSEASYGRIELAVTQKAAPKAGGGA